jgi:alkylation response protein AidB-like acyl-CoA dehydrogenase
MSIQLTDEANHVRSRSLADLPFSEFLASYKATLKDVFHRRGDMDQFSQKRELPPYVLRDVRSCDPLSVFVPSEYGGRGGKVREAQAILAASSYESLALSLTVGINGALFVQPVSKYGDESIKAGIFKRILDEKHMGGLMITEPEYGSDALSMRTSFEEDESAYNIRGTKHWAGLTGWADFWLLTARRRDGAGQLDRDIDFFICDVTQPDQRIVVEEFYNNLGLYMIPYGRNRIDVRVPKEARLQPRSTGIMMMLDLLHRSRTQFPGMAMGFLQRILDEGIEHSRRRYVGGTSLFTYDQVQERLSRMQASFTLCSAMCAFAAENADLERNMARDNVSANSIKSVITDLMQDAAQSLLQLEGAKGYRMESVAGRSLVDSRPFQIFEGSNDILYQQISEGVLKMMRKARQSNLAEFLRTYNLTQRVADRFKDSLDFSVDLQLPQRKLVDLGKAIGRVVSMEFVVDMGERGYRSDLVQGALDSLKREVDMIATDLRLAPVNNVVEDYEDQSNWLDFLKS